METGATLPKGLYFRILGELGADLDGRPLDLGPRLQRQLLAILLSESNRIIAVDRLIELLWNEPPAAAIASLQAYVSQLRRVLEPERPPRAAATVLVTSDPGYALRVGPEQIDAHRFQARASAGRAALDAGDPAAADAMLDDALGLWRGGALVEFGSEPWALPIVARLHEAKDVALEDRIDAWLALGRHTLAASQLEELVAQRPMRERRWSQMIVATYRSGRQADALRAYQRCRAYLGDELGIEPGPHLRQLEAAVLAQDPRLDHATAPPTPVSATNGRDVPQRSAPDGGAQAATGGDREGAVEIHAVQRARLALGAAEAAAGRGGIVVLVGEPGVGKTTLAEQAADAAASGSGPVRALWTRCLDPSSAPPFWPWAQLLRRLGGGRAVNAALGRLEGDGGSEGGEAALFSAYEAVLEALLEATAAEPLVVVVDDLHAADTASLRVLELVAGDLARLPVFVVATLRNTEPSAALDRTLGELLRHRGAERLVVPPLLPDEVAAMVERVCGERPSGDAVEALYERTGGNVLYLLELTRLLTTQRSGQQGRDGRLSAADVRRLDVPEGVRDVILRRVARLPDNTRTLLTLASVSGSEADLDLLERAAALDSEQLMLALEPAVAGGILTAADDGGWRYRFRHPLIRESLYTGIQQVERRRLHARIAAALEELPDTEEPSRLAALAHQWSAAGRLGDPGKAVAYLRRAARQAARVGAWSNAIDLCEQALAVLDGTGRPDTGVRVDLLIELGRVHRQAGSIPRSHECLGAAVRLADAAGDEDRLLEAAVAFGHLSIWGSREWGETDHRLVAILERQLRRLDEARTAAGGNAGASDGARRVRLTSTLACELYFGVDASRGWVYAQQALQLARGQGDPETLGIGMSGYLLSSLTNNHLAERNAVIEQLLAQPELGLGPDAEAVLRANRLTERLRFGEIAAFDIELPEVRRLATDVLHSRELEGQLGLIEACRAIITGDVPGGMAIAERAFAVLDSPTWFEPSALVLETTGLLVTHAMARMADDFAARLRCPRHVSIPHLAAPAAALGYAERGDDERARRLAEEWFEPPQAAWTWMQPVAYWAQVAARLGVPDPEWLYRALLPHAGQLALVGVGADCGGGVDALLAGLLIRLGRYDEAVKRAQSGLALERRAGARQWLERTTGLLDTARSLAPA